MKTFYFSVILIGLMACQSAEMPKTETETAYISFEENEPQDSTHAYPWYRRLKSKNMLVNRIPTPEGFSRIKVKVGSFGHWLRHLPLKKPNTKVYYYNDQEKHTQEIHEGVIDIDIGNEDLQKSEDAVIRLRAEYLFAHKRFEEVVFMTQNQDTLALISISKTPSYKQFRKYLDELAIQNSPLSFTESLDFITVNELAIGDVFVQPADPGHAAIVVDLAENEARQRIFLLAQAFTPAQDMHIIKNFDNAQIFRVWYPTNFGTTLYTPEWEFTMNDLMRFRQ